MPRIRRNRLTKRRSRVKRSYGARKRRLVVRRSAYRRKRGRRSVVSVLSGAMRFPNRKRVKLVYKDIRQWVALQPQAPYSTPFALQIRANCVYDPQYATGGHQPMYFDQWSTWYKRFCVTGSKITFKLRPIGRPIDTVNAGQIDVVNMPCLIGAGTIGIGTWAGGLTEQLENAVTNPDFKFSRFNSNRGITDDHRLFLSHKWSARKFFGKRDIIDDPNNCGVTQDNTAAVPALTGNSPVADVCYNPYFQVNSTSQTDNLTYEVETTVVYNVWFFERRRRVIQS